ncbi:divergent polysaccharide deacetylase family protein [Roseinatronobacter sp. NSM]|uniref:divergent polysaccharide deacetylase family protein n=1 Tax=Roseinatronobacter sp. NSM TaxID=3457785 RepID=UPI004036C9BB
MNSIGVAGFGLGLVIAAVGVLGLAVAFPPQVSPPAPMAVIDSENPTEGEPLIAADGGGPELVLSDAVDQPPAVSAQTMQTDGADADRPVTAAVPELPRHDQTRPQDAVAPSAPADDRLAPIADGAGDVASMAQIPDLSAPVVQAVPDRPMAARPPAALSPDAGTTADMQADMPADAPPAPVRQDARIELSPVAQGTGRAPGAGDDMPPSLPAPLPAQTRGANTDAAPLPDTDQPQPAPPATQTPPGDAADPVPVPADAPDGAAMPGTRVAGLPGLPPSPRAPVSALPVATDDAGSDDTEADDMDTGAPELAGTALERNAIPVEGAADQPFMAIVLNDPGLPMPLRRDLAARDLPFTVALNPMDPSATEAAELYHGAGKEVLILANGIPAGATASDIDVTFGAYFDNVPLAAGVIDLPRDGFVRNTRLSSEVMKVLARDGYGLVTFAGGLGQAARSAAAMGVPHAEIFRTLDAEDESALTIRRFLDRAVFQASQVGFVMVFGEASTQSTLDALDLWQSEGRVDQISLVPVSAILLRQ